MANADKVTKKECYDFVRTKLETSDKWILEALVKIFEYQTSYEQQTEHTAENNGVGFTGADGRILTGMAKFYNRNKYLSEKQKAIVKRRIPKYAGQLTRLFDQEKLIQLVLKRRK